MLAPTRELAAQIERELAPLAAVRDLRVDTVYGGVGYDSQKKAMARGVDILVACPGRLLDLVRQRIVNLNDVDRVVIDEADRLADMGFLDDVRKLIDMTSRDRQTLLFSATLDGEVAVLTRNYQHNPVRHEVGTKVRDSARKATHFFWQVLPHERIATTVKVVEEAGPTIVFCSTRHATDRVARQLQASGIRMAAIHGGRDQRQRDAALKAFQDGRVSALVATDVAARGIHVDNVACVLHFDPPQSVKGYVHRSGRTGRAGATGAVVMLVGPEDTRWVKELQRSLHIEGEVVAPDFGQLAVFRPDEHSHPIEELAALDAEFGEYDPGLDGDSARAAARDVGIDANGKPRRRRSRTRRPSAETA